jgi:hypothetical protein
VDAHTPNHEDDLNECERCLARWRPAADGLDADAMLFAAGLAAGRRGSSRWFWPALCALLAVQTAGLGWWGLGERAERRTLASLLRQSTPAVVEPPAARREAVPPPPYTPTAGDYVSLRRLIEQDPNRWLASPPSAAAQAPEPPPPEPAILRSHQREGLLDP